jgi:hypothetical protein
MAARSIVGRGERPTQMIPNTLLSSNPPREDLGVLGDPEGQGGLGDDRVASGVLGANRDAGT